VFRVAIGAVYNGTSFVFSDSRRVGDYLREAGGATRTAMRATRS
jgi:hypothetical protein